MRNFKSITKQKGALAILMAFIIGIGVITYLLQSLDPQKLRAEQDAKTMRALNDAKAALIAWSVSHQFNPGQMPWPDRNADGNYDGSSDCSPVAGVFTPQLMLGQLPTLPTTAPCLDPNTGLNLYAGLSTYPGLGQEFEDAQGNRLWYAVSRNLVFDYENNEAPIINSGMINGPHAITPYLRQGGTQSYPWLRILDRNGNLVSDRVAVVLIASGDPIGGQNRAGVANQNQFLDSFQIGAANFSNSDSALVDEDYVIGADSRDVSANDATFAQPYYFNDKLVYITIDELMAALEKRVGEEVRAQLSNYKQASDATTPLVPNDGYYPYATQLGTAANFSCWQNSLGTDGLKEGFLPSNYQACNYVRVTAAPNSSSLTCINTIFNPAASLGITQVRFTRTGGSNFTSQTGACVRTNTTCTCTGAGTCFNVTNSPRVVCSNTGCSASGTGSLGSYRTTGDKFTYRASGCTQPVFPNPNALTSCATNNAQINCSGSNGTFASCGDPRFDTFLPAWFNQNRWGSLVYYRMTVPRLPLLPVLPQLLVGNRNAEALIVTVGRPIDSAPFPIKGANQVRTNAATRCSQLNEYLDSAENVDGNTVYDATSTQRSLNYNDQNFVVSP